MLRSLLFVIYSSLLIAVWIIEALFITHARSQWNTLDPLDGMAVKDDTHSSANHRMNNRLQGKSISPSHSFSFSPL